MAKIDNKYYLALEMKPKNYFPINLLDLKIAQGFTTFKLEELDKFTLKYTKKEIINAIKDANIIEIEEDVPLVIIYHEKKEIRKISALTKDINFDMWACIKENYENKEFLNKIYNFLNKKIENDLWNELKNSKNLNAFLAVISSLSYILQRKLYFYLYEK